MRKKGKTNRKSKHHTEQMYRFHQRFLSPERNIIIIVVVEVGLCFPPWWRRRRRLCCRLLGRFWRPITDHWKLWCGVHVCSLPRMRQTTHTLTQSPREATPTRGLKPGASVLGSFHGLIFPSLTCWENFIHLFASYCFRPAFVLFCSWMSLEEVEGKVRCGTGSARMAALTEAAGSLKMFHLQWL